MQTVVTVRVIENGNIIQRKKVHRKEESLVRC